MAGEAHFEVFPEHFNPTPYAEGKRTEYRWRFQGANGEIMASSGEGFTRREDANRAIHDLLAAIYADGDPHPPIIDVDR